MGCGTSTPESSGDDARPPPRTRKEREAARRSALSDMVTLVSRDKRHFSVPRRGVEMSRKLAELAARKPKVNVDVDGDVLQLAADYLVRHGLADLSRFREAVYLAKGDRDFEQSLSVDQAVLLRRAARAMAIGPLAALAGRRADELGRQDSVVGHAAAAGDEDSSKLVRVLGITGGPCSGKTVSLETLRERLEESGFNVLTVPEVPTILIADCGASFPGFDEHRRHELLEFEANLLQLQRRFEDAVVGIAASSKRPSVVLCDRGLLDVSAYLPAELWGPVLERAGLTHEEASGRYHAVVHLQTAAIGAEAYYTNANNSARRETVEQAREMDAAVLRAWESHENLHVVKNGPGGWDEKITEVIRVVLGSLGVEAERAAAEAEEDAQAVAVVTADSGSSVQAAE